MGSGMAPSFSFPDNLAIIWLQKPAGPLGARRRAYRFQSFPYRASITAAWPRAVSPPGTTGLSP